MKEDFTEYDIKPKEFINYLRYNGHHFNKNLCEYVCSYLNMNDYNKENLEALAKAHNIIIPNNELYDAVVVANWCKVMFYGSSIIDEKHLALFVKDIFEKEHDLIFNRWYADMAKQGISIEWESMI